MTDYTAKTIILKDANGNYLIPYTEKQDRLSTAQLKAVDSGITSDKVNTYDSSLGNIQNKQDKLTETQLSAVNSTVTSTKVSNYDTHLTNTDLHVTSAEKEVWNNKVDENDLGAMAFANKVSAGDIDGTLAQSTITNLESDLSSKANTSDLGELAFKDKIVGSDITGTLAQGKIAGLTTALSNKQDKLIAGEGITIIDNVISSYGSGDSGSSSGSVSKLIWITNKTGTQITRQGLSASTLARVYKNGLLLEPNEDYSIANSTITFVSSLETTDKITLEVGAKSFIDADSGFDFIGTLAEYEEAQETLADDAKCFITDDSGVAPTSITAEQLNAKADLDLSNVSSNIDYVVETKLPTSLDPTWYRVYKSGWVEQGGIIDTYSTAGWQNGKVITLVKPMRDNLYVVSWENGWTSYTSGGTVVTDTTTTSFSISAFTSYNSSKRANWQVSGQGA